MSELLTLSEAALEFGLPKTRLNRWVKRGHLRVVGRRKGPGPGGLLVVERGQLALFLVTPRRVGRPRKNGAKLVP